MKLPLLERHATGMQPLLWPHMKTEGACDTLFKLQDDEELVDTPRVSGTTRVREAGHATWARVRSMSPMAEPHWQASARPRISIPVTPRGSMPMNEEPFNQEEVEVDSSTAWMRVRTPSPELTYSRMSGATTPSAVLMLVPMMPPPPNHGGQQQQQQHQRQNQHQHQHQPYQARQLIWMMPVPYPETAPASNPFLDIASPSGAGMQHHVPEVGTQEDASTAGQAGNGEKGMPVAPHVNAGVTSDAETEVMLQASPVPDDEHTKKVLLHQPTVPDEVLQSGTISQPESDHPISLGSVGHPNFCAQPCKYVRKTRGCKDGDKCANCHCCVWRSHRRTRARASARHS